MPLKKEIKKEIQRKIVPIPKKWVSKKAQSVYCPVQSPISSKPLTQNYSKTIQRDQTAPQCEDAPATGSEENAEGLSLQQLLGLDKTTDYPKRLLAHRAAEKIEYSSPNTANQTKVRKGSASNSQQQCHWGYTLAKVERTCISRGIYPVSRTGDSLNSYKYGMAKGRGKGPDSSALIVSLVGTHRLLG